MIDEDYEFNRIELEASMRKAAVKSTVGKHTIEMAREAAGDDWGLFKDFMPELKAFEALVRADEREVCAKVWPDWKAEYLKSVESGCITLDELREARAELDGIKQALAAQSTTEDSSATQPAPVQSNERDIRNATLDEIASKIALMPFGDTAASFAVWIREQKQ